MEANSLFKTRQLTSYRNWSNNKKGCLFYVPDDGFFDNGRGGIYFMTNAFWREGEKEGECNHLHPFEYTLLKNHCVVRGYAAFLYPYMERFGRGIRGETGERTAHQRLLPRNRVLLRSRR